MQIFIQTITILYAIGLGLLHLLNYFYRNTLSPLALVTTFSPFLFLPLIGLIGLLFFLSRKKRDTAFVISMCAGLFFWTHPILPNPATYPIQVPTKDASISAMTFNVGWNVTPIEDLAQTIAESDADLIALQEVSAAEAKHISTALFGQYPYQVLNTDISSNGLLSKHPIMLANWHYPPAGRPILETEIKINDRLINLFVVHFLTPDIPRHPMTRLPIGLEEDYLNIEADFLIHRVQQAGTKVLERPTLVMGDFNMSEQSSAYKEIRTHLRDSFRDAGIGFGLTFPNHIQIQERITVFPIVRIDYIFYRGEIKALSSEVFCFENRSDHCALQSQFVLSNDS